jgi:raffinose/stachyose/melibiose transport system permease protein
MRPVKIGGQGGKIRPVHIAGFILFILIAAAFIFPVLISFMSAFKSNGEILNNPVGLPKGFFVWRKGQGCSFR